ncbi:hypothetical protein M9Y10_025708 [Tritrichomonas musculus]|uniref:Uncharacterized protein n=1 Tax=Tritrichomonas musculus TaxID=1915356 RepID=A0ABR2H9G6_9EUKA
MSKIPNFSETTKRDLISIFIQESRRKRKKLMDALLRCSSAEDQSPAETLRSAIDSITDTISALKAGTKSLEDLKRYHIAIALPISDIESNVLVSIELKQRDKSPPLPLSHFIEVKSPLGDVTRTPIIKKRTNIMYQYTHTFDMGERNPRQIERLRSSDIEFRIIHRVIVLGKTKNVVKAMATAPLSPLAYSLNTSAPLIFMNLDGVKSNIIFDVRISVTAPLVSSEDLLVDEDIAVVM